MVVHNLYAYIWDNIPTVSRPFVSLKEIATAHQRKFCGSPVLVVDGQEAIRLIIASDHNCLMHEMQWRDYINMARSFVERMAASNIRLVLYFHEGHRLYTSTKKHQRNVPNPEEKVFISEIFETVKSGNRPNHIRLPPYVLACFRYIFQYKCDCTVYCCSLSDIHREIARFATNTPECFAILSKNFDFLIFETKPLLSPTHFNMISFKTNIFLRSELLIVSKLKPEQLPLLALMAGNDMITPDDLHSFHCRLSPIKKGFRDRDIVNEIVDVIRSKKWNCKREYYSEIAQEVGITEELVEKCIQFYDISSNDSEILENTSDALTELSNRYRHCRAPANLYSILKFRTYTQGVTMEDPEDKSMPSSAQIYMPIRQRMYHIMFDQAPVAIEEWCICKNQYPDEPDLVESNSFEISGVIPPTCDLLSEKVEANVRWELFCSCLGISISSEEIQLIDHPYITLCSLLNFLIHCEGLHLEEFEVKAFICQALLMDTYHLIEEQMVSCRSISLLGILWRGISILMCVVPACGYPFSFENVMPWKYLDGRVFYKCYNSLENGISPDDLLDNKIEAINTFRQLYSAAVVGTHLDKNKKN